MNPGGGGSSNPKPTNPPPGLWECGHTGHSCIVHLFLPKQTEGAVLRLAVLNLRVGPLLWRPPLGDHFRGAVLDVRLRLELRGRRVGRLALWCGCQRGGGRGTRDPRKNRNGAKGGASPRGCREKWYRFFSTLIMQVVQQKTTLKKGRVLGDRLAQRLRKFPEDRLDIGLRTVSPEENLTKNGVACVLCTKEEEKTRKGQGKLQVPLLCIKVMGRQQNAV